jgi:hypothetical protein
VSDRISKPNRESTLAVYQSKWKVFCDWCNGGKRDPLASTAPIVADFLLEKFDSGLSTSTIAGYRTAIAKTLLPVTSIDLGQDADLTALLHNFEVQKPAQRNKLPEWDLSLVLNRLSSEPFEPLEKAPLKLLTWKTLFLITLASGKRRSEVHALDVNKVQWKENFSKMCLGVIPSFLSKTQLASSPPLAFEIPALSKSVGQDLDDNKLCPVRAMRIYLDRTRTLREGKKLLFISYKQNFDKDIRANTVSFWLKKCIKLCYELADIPTDSSFKVKAHDVRALAASTAFMARVPLQKVMEACSWASHNTFTSFYLRDLTWQDRDGLRIVSCVAAQAVT